MLSGMKAIKRNKMMEKHYKFAKNYFNKLVQNNEPIEKKISAETTIVQCHQITLVGALSCRLVTAFFFFLPRMELASKVNSFGLDCKDLDEHCCMQFKGLSIFYILAFSCNF